MQFSDDLNSDTLMVNNPKSSKVSPKIHIIGNGGWATFKSEGNCTGGGTFSDPYVISDLNIDAGGSGSGIIIENSDVYFKIKNCTVWNTGQSTGNAGINLNGVMNGIIENNTLYNVNHGIEFDTSDNNLILNNTILDSSYAIFFYRHSHNNNVTHNFLKDVSFGVESYYTNSNITVYNNTILSSLYGIELAGVNHIITDNLIKDSPYGIWIDGSHNSKIIRNLINEGRSGGYGLAVIDSDNVIIINNSVVYGNYDGLYIVRSNYNEIVGNIVSYTYGVIIASSSYVKFLNNTSTFNLNSGLDLNGGDHNKIFKNNVHNNDDSGFVIQSSFSNISDNKIHNNGVYGLYIQSSFNNITKNILRDDAGGPYGGEIIVSGNNNSIFENYFINPLFSYALGRDRGNDNKWNSSSIGNYWSSYTGVDADDDGIGDTPYSFYAENYDFLPIWWDSPQILINSPTENDVFELSPTFNISISRGQVNNSWYTIDNGITNVTFQGLSGIIDNDEWNAKSAEPIILTFYVNDSKGYIGSGTVQFNKSYDTPQITINSPTLNEVFGSNSPAFSITVNDLSPINATWYTIDGGLTNYTFTGFSGIVNLTTWNNKGTGIIYLRFYANDSLGFIGFKDVIILKDITSPNIIINAPIEDNTFGSSSPEFNISIIEENLVSTWYTLEGVTGSFSFKGLTGRIDQGIWESIPQGEISITFYAEDAAGNIGYESVIVRKTTPSQPEIPGYDISIIFLGILSISVIYLLKKRKNY